MQMPKIDRQALLSEHLKFAKETHERFNRFREISGYLGRASLLPTTGEVSQQAKTNAINLYPDLTPDFTKEIHEATEIIGQAVLGQPTGATYEGSDGLEDTARICSVGLASGEGFVFMVSKSPNEKPTEISLTQITHFVPMR